MDDLRDAEVVVDPRIGDAGAGRSLDLGDDVVDARRGARDPDTSMPRSGVDAFDAVLRRAVSEQLAEQRLMRETLTGLDRRLQTLERAVSERLDASAASEVSEVVAVGERIERFERAVSERMAAFESVLKRIVDRLGGAEERITQGLAHTDRVTRAQLEALRPSFDAAVERVAEDVDGSLEILARAVERLGEGIGEGLEAVEERLRSELGSKVDSTAGEIERRVSQVEGEVEEGVQRLAEAVAHSERVTGAQLEALRPTVEAAVLMALNPELDRALEALRAALADTSRKIQRDVNGLAYLIRRQGVGVDGFEPVDDAGERDAGARPKRRRDRPLRARRATA